MIEVNQLKKSFGPVEALRGVSFRAEDGAITGLLGPNGAGKTTTLRVLYTILQPDGGTARIDRLDVVTDRLAVQQRIGVLPDSKGLYPRLTCRENIRYFGCLHGLGGEELERRIDQLIQLLDMQEIADRRTEGFSTGERSKVAIARALIHNPPNVLLDEPTSGLDVMSVRTMRTFIRRLRDEGKCVVFSSHIMQEVAMLCDCIVVIAAGEVVNSGSPDELRRATGKENLEDAFVAALGSEEGLLR
ncbi:MAG TPA: ATP-binding cassette domain-containing protein [Anaerolineaceae bacterium]|nr:ATP-binding cassette domain-containing protein [Anaerolineaceae bacterium]